MQFVELKKLEGFQLPPRMKLSAMDEKINKEVGPEKEVESEFLDIDELEKIAGGTGPSGAPYYAPDGTILPQK